MGVGGGRDVEGVDEENECGAYFTDMGRYANRILQMEKNTSKGKIICTIS